MNLKLLVGKFIYSIAKKMPESYSKVNLGSKRIRALCGLLLFEYCGKNVNIDKGATLGHHIILDDYSGIGKNSYISDYVHIGRYVMMGPECLIYTRNHEYRDYKTPMCFQGFQNYKPVVIEDDVWIGGRVTILPGVKIGKGAIIGAGSVVTKDVAKYNVVAGNPARTVKVRTEQKNVI